MKGVVAVVVVTVQALCECPLLAARMKWDFYNIRKSVYSCSLSCPTLLHFFSLSYYFFLFHLPLLPSLFFSFLFRCLSCHLHFPYYCYNHHHLYNVFRYIYYNYVESLSFLSVLLISIANWILF